MILKLFKGFAIVLGMLIGLFALGVVWPDKPAPLPSAGDDFLLRNVRVLDVRTGTFSDLTAVRVQDGVIDAIDPQLAPSADRPVLDGKGGYLVPGFWDMHVHAFQLSPQLHLPLLVANGVTSVRDMMDCPEEKDPLIACVRDKRRWTGQAERGEIASPRFMQVASFYFDQPAMKPDEALRRAALYRQRGLDAIKVYNRAARDTYFALAADARKSGIPLVGHLPKAVALDEAVSAGQRSFEHGHVLIRHCFKDAAAWRAGKLDKLSPAALLNRMVAEQDATRCDGVFRQMRTTGAALVPTHVTREEDVRAVDPAFLSDSRMDYLDPLSRWAFKDDLAATASRYPGEAGASALETYFELGLDLTGKAYRAGVPILVGTDTALGGFRYHDELAHLVRAGLSPAEALKAATLDAASFAGVAHKFGSIERGKAADLVLLSANPLDDIRNTRRIELVVLAGRRYDNKGLNALLEYTRSEAHSPSNWAKLVWGFLTSPVSAEL